MLYTLKYSCNFLLSVKFGVEMKLPIRVGYYNRDKDCNIYDDQPFFDYHEEMTRHEDDKCLLLYASLVYKSE